MGYDHGKNIWERVRMGDLNKAGEYTKNELRAGGFYRIYYKTWGLSGGIMERIPWRDDFTVFPRRFDKRRI